MTKCFKLFRKGQMVTCRIDNCRKYQKFLNGLDPSKSKVILKDNRKEFKKIFVQAPAIWNKEFKFLIWFVNFLKEKFVIFTTKEKGTVIEIRDTTLEQIESKSEVIISFVKYLINMIEKAEE